MKCKSCKSPLDALDAFPGNVCLDCWKRTPEGRHVPTAEELAQMWGGKPARNA